MADTRLRLILEAQTKTFSTNIKTSKKDVVDFKDSLKDLGQEANKAFEFANKPVKVNVDVEGFENLEKLTEKLKDGLPELKLDGAIRGGADSDWFKEEAESAKKYQSILDNVSNKLKSFAQQADRSVHIIESVSEAIRGNEFLDAARQVEVYEAQLKSLIGSAEGAKEEIRRLSEYASQTPFDLPGLVEADIQLRSFQVSVEKFLPVATTLAAVAGRTVPEAAQALGKALSGIPEGLTQLQESFRITKADIIAAGAAIDNTGAISIKTVRQVEKLGEAIKKASEKKFGNIIKEQSDTLEGALSNLGDSAFRLKAALGESFLPVAVAAANATAKVADVALNLVQVFNAIPTEVKQVAGAFIAVAIGAAKIAPVLIRLLPLITSAASAIVAFGQNFGIATALAGGVGRVIAGLISTINPLIPILIAVAAAAVTMANAIADIRYENEEAEKFVETQERISKAGRENKDVLGKTAEEIKNMGKGAYEATAALGELIQQLELLREEQYQADKNGASPEEKKAIQDRIDAKKAEIAATRAVRQELAAQELQAGKTRDAVVKGADDAAEAYVRFEQKRKERIFATKKEELDAQDAIQKKVEQSLKDLAKKREQASKTSGGENSQIVKDLDKRINEQKAIETKIKDDRIDLERDALQETLNLRTQALNHEVALGKKSKAEQAQVLRDLANEFGKLQQEKIQLIQQAEQLELEAQREIKQAVIDRLETEKSAYEDKITNAERSLQLTSEVGKAELALKQLVQEKFANEISLIKQKAALEKESIADPKLRAELEKKTAAEISHLREQEKVEIRNVSDAARDARQKQLQINAQLIESEKQLAEATLSGIQRQFDKGEEVAGKLIEQKKKLAGLSEDEARAQEQVALKGAKTAEERKLIETQTNAQIKADRIRLAQETEDIEIESARKTAQRKIAELDVRGRGLEEIKAQLEDDIRLGNLSVGIEERKKDLINQQLAIEIDKLNAKKDADIINANEVDKARIEKDTRQQITAAIRQSKEAMKEVTKEYTKGTSELDKQLKLLDKIRGKLQSLEQEEESIRDQIKDQGYSTQDQEDRLGQIAKQKDDAKYKEKQQADKTDKAAKKDERDKEYKANDDLRKKDRAKQAADTLRSRGYSEEQIKKTIETNFGKGAYDLAMQKDAPKTDGKPGENGKDGKSGSGAGYPGEPNAAGPANAGGDPQLATIIQILQGFKGAAQKAPTSTKGGKPTPPKASKFDQSETAFGGYPGEYRT